LRTAIAAGPKLTTMGLAGRAVAEAQFSWTVSADRMMGVLVELLERTP
jgi:hypothetical protein